MNNAPAPPSLLSRVWPTIAYLLVAFGVPGTLIPSLYKYVVAHPWLTVMAVAVYEVIVLIGSFLLKIWQQLESRWVDRIADRFDAWVSSIFSHYQKQYCQYLIYQHRDFDVKGLTTQGTFTLELDQVFVELSVDPTPLHALSSNPIPIPQVLSQGNHAIWEYLASPALANQHFAIIGPPGSGKTTLLKHIVLSLVVDHNRRRPHTRLPQTLPILLFLRDHADAIVKAAGEQQEFSLEDALHAHLKQWEQPEPPAGWVKRQLVKGRCLILLDGLDEVANVEVRKKIVAWVQRQMVAYGKNRFIVTSRPFGYRDNPLNGVTVLEVRPFTDEQVNAFIQRWYLANEIMSKQKDDPGVRMRARAGAKELLQRLRNIPAIYALAVNPLLLTMIATVHRYRGRLPGQRVALYAEICEVFLGKRQEARGQQLELSSAQMQLVLQPLAYHLMCEGKREISLAEANSVIEETLKTVSHTMDTITFLKQVENISGLLLEREHDIYSFAHLTFQEYLAAVHIHRENQEALLVALINFTWWHETIRLYCAIADATAIIRACFSNKLLVIPTLVLAIECSQECLSIASDVKEQLDSLIEEGIEDNDPQRQHIFADALLARRLHPMVPFDEDTYIDTSFITCAEYQIFLDERRAQGHYHRPDHWMTHRFAQGQGRLPVLGARSSDAVIFCAWLTERERGLWRYRLPKIDEWEKLSNERITTNFQVGSGYWCYQGKGFTWIEESTDRRQSLYLAIEPDHIFGLVHDLKLACDRASKCPLDLDHVLDFANGLDGSRDHNRFYPLDLDHTLDRAYIRDFTYPLSRTLGLARIAFEERTMNSTHNIGPASLRVRLLRKAVHLFAFRQARQRGESYHQYLTDLIDYYLDVYMNLAILKARRQGTLPAWEGILLVKERKQDTYSITPVAGENQGL